MPRKIAPKKVSDLISEDRGAIAKPKRGAGVVVTVIVIIVVIVVAWFFWGQMGGGMKLPGYSASSNDWSAVFLSNGQVYFGKVKARTKRDIVLADIYYLQVVTVPLQRTQEVAAADGSTQQELKLIKLGNELHGPADAMVINRDHTLLVEKLKEDSRVVEAINDYLASQE